MIRVGITCGLDEAEKIAKYYVNADYVKAIQEVGGVPLLLPCDADLPRVGRLLEVVDAVLLPGGVDVDPSLFDEEPMQRLGRIDPERDASELVVARSCLERGIPILGVCRGIQVLNVAAGGGVYQDIGSQVEAPILHYQRAPRWYPTHAVRVDAGSKLFELMNGLEELRVNSFHHQSPKDVPDDFSVTARAHDGVIEAMESRKHPFAVGVQWHPEGMWERDRRFLSLFRGLVEAGERRVERRRAA